MLLDILKGFIIGICASVPLGPIAILVIQKSLSEGHKSGFLVGLGACLVDTLFAVIAIFALAIAEAFMKDYSALIMVGGGIIVTLLGCSLALKDPFRKMKQEDSTPSYSLKDFFQAVIMGISNPGAILVIFALFAFFGIELEPHDFRVAPILLALSAKLRIVLVLLLMDFQPDETEFQVGYDIVDQQDNGYNSDYNRYCASD